MTIDFVSFPDEWERRRHYRKHVIDQKENFPYSIFNDLEYEKKANNDLSQFTYLSIAEDYHYERKFSYIRVHQNTNTIAITSTRFHDKKLLTYFVPEVTLIPEFLFFSHLFTKLSHDIFNKSSLSSFIFEPMNSISNYLTWSKEIFSDFIVMTKDVWNHKTLNFVLFFVNERISYTRKGKYTEFQLFLLGLLKTFCLKPSLKIPSPPQKNLLEKLRDYILFADNQLQSNNAMIATEKTTYTLFIIAYLNWLYSKVENCNSINVKVSGDFIYNSYFKIFNQLEKNYRI
jgi:hypothetical protein